MEAQKEEPLFDKS